MLVIGAALATHTTAYTIPTITAITVHTAAISPLRLIPRQHRVNEPPGKKYQVAFYGLEAHGTVKRWERRGSRVHEVSQRALPPGVVHLEPAAPPGDAHVVDAADEGVVRHVWLVHGARCVHRHPYDYEERQ